MEKLPQSPLSRAVRGTTARRRVLFAAVLSFFLASGTLTVTAQDYIVIVNESNPVALIDQQRLSRIFLKKIARWDDGTSIFVVDLEKRSRVREQFTEEIHKRTLSTIESYWQAQVFSGRGTPPIEMSSSNEVLRLVLQNPQAIGYVASGTPLENGVRRVTVTE